MSETPAGQFPIPLREANTPPPTSLPELTPVRVLQDKSALLLTSLTLGLTFNALFLENKGSLGINVPLFIFALVAVLIVFGLREGKKPIKANLLLTGLPLGFFATMIFVRDNGVLTFSNVLACILLLALIAIYFCTGSIPLLGVGGLLGAPFHLFGKSLVAGGSLVWVVGGDTETHRRTGKRVLPVLRGLLLALPVLAVLIALFHSADAVFAKVVDDLIGWIFTEDILERCGRLFWSLIVAFFVAGAIAYSLTRQATPQKVGVVRSPWLGFTEAMTVLTCVNLVFVAFIGIQFAYLFGGAQRVLSVPGLTYAEYARSGFAELNFIAFLTLTLVAGLKAWTKRETTGQGAGFAIIGTLLLGLTLIVLGSSFQRMAAYEAALGASEMRLYVDVFIVWLGIALVYFAATLWTNLPFGIGVYGCAVGALVTLNVINPDLYIVRANATRYAATQRLDVDYLLYLSSDATPELCRLYQKLPEGEQKDTLGRRLHDILEARQQEAKNQGWPVRHLAREQARVALKRIEPALPLTGQWSSENSQ